MLAEKKQTLGVLMLKTSFPRPQGDVGNPSTWPEGTLFQVVEPATVSAVVTCDSLPTALLDAFVEAGQELVRQGATLITTSCGFLVIAQETLAEALAPTAVITSSLLQIPSLQASLTTGQNVGVLTFDARRLSPSHLAAAGADVGSTSIAGLQDDNELFRVITGDLAELDAVKAEADVLQAGDALQAGDPQLAAVVLECTNLPPYRQTLEMHLGPCMI